MHLLIVSWDTLESRRAFFVRYAKENGFDPFNPLGWYSQPLGRIRAIRVYLCFFLLLLLSSSISSHSCTQIGTQGVEGIIRYHGSVKQALLDLFPSIGLDSSKFLFDRMFL